MSNDTVQRPSTVQLPAAPANPLPPSISVVVKESGSPVPVTPRRG